MRKFLAHYVRAEDPTAPPAAALAETIDAQAEAIAAAVKEDPFGGAGIAPGSLHDLDPADLRVSAADVARGRDLAPVARAILRLFHNMRAALHVPDRPPDVAPPASGPGRNDAFGLLSYSFFGRPTPYAPVKFGLVWNLENRRWVHWDGNTSSPIARNLLAALGLGAPLVSGKARLDVKPVERHTALSERIRPPRYPFAVNAAAARRGEAHYRTLCASCHDGPEDDRRLMDVGESGTDPTRARAFTPGQAQLFNRFFLDTAIPGFRPPDEPTIRSTGRYWAADLAGVWARSPYLHNGSVRTLEDLLTPPDRRPARFRRGSRIYDAERMGYADDGPYTLDTTAPGNSNRGHAYGTDLKETEKRDVIEYLKTK
jgi:hypothetical protein